MGIAKKMYRIRSTGELCVCEGSDVHLSLRDVQVSKHVQLIDPTTFDLTGVTRNVSLSDLADYPMGAI
jgi:hypothetical protein